MSLEEYNMEQDRRIGALANEVSTVRETARHLSSGLDKLEQGQKEISLTLQRLSESNSRMEATLSFNISALIDKKQEPLKAEIQILRDESLIRRTQLAMIVALSSAAGGGVMAVIAFGIKLWIGS